MSSPFVAEIRIFPFNFAPKGWAFCDGQLMPISQNTALFSLLGTMYGGDGKSTFALPDLQGSAPIHFGQGPGLTERFQGEQGGTDTVTLLQSEIPLHTHAVNATTAAGTQNDPTNGVWAEAKVLRQGKVLYGTTADQTMNPVALSPAGGSLPHDNLMPYLTLNFCIAQQGIFPARG